MPKATPRPEKISRPSQPSACAYSPMRCRCSWMDFATYCARACISLPAVLILLIVHPFIIHVEALNDQLPRGVAERHVDAGHRPRQSVLIALDPVNQGCVAPQGGVDPRLRALGHDPF